MYNPPHPGQLIFSIYMEPYNVSCQVMAAKLGIRTSTLQKIINGSLAVSPEMAKILSMTLGRTTESWIAMQENYDLWLLSESEMGKNSSEAFDKAFDEKRDDIDEFIDWTGAVQLNSGFTQ